MKLFRDRGLRQITTVAALGMRPRRTRRPMRIRRHLPRGLFHGPSGWR